MASLKNNQSNSIWNFLHYTFAVSYGMLLYKTNSSGSIIIKEQGSFAAGGTVISNAGSFDAYKPTAAGQTFHGDHLYTFYQIPVNAHKYPLVMWHGIGQFSKTWETTPDGREGFQNIFLRKRFPVYLIDQPFTWRNTPIPVK